MKTLKLYREADSEDTIEFEATESGLEASIGTSDVPPFIGLGKQSIAKLKRFLNENWPDVRPETPVVGVLAIACCRDSEGIPVLKQFIVEDDMKSSLHARIHSACVDLSLHPAVIIDEHDAPQILGMDWTDATRLTLAKDKEAK